jgi:eukaryotic translation initiation factor 2C
MNLHPSKGASFFPPPVDPASARILKGLEIWAGFYSSLRPGVERLFLNVDTTSQPMYQSGDLIRVMQDFTRRFQRGQQGPPADISAAGLAQNGRLQIELSRFLSGIKITLMVKDADGNYPSRKIKALERLAADKTFFTIIDTNQKTNIAAYFASQYKRKLEFPNYVSYFHRNVGLCIVVDESLFFNHTAYRCCIKGCEISHRAL